MGPKTLPTTWGTNMKLVTKYQSRVINIKAYWLSELNLFIPPLPRGGGGYTVLPLSVRPSKIYIFAEKSVTKSVHIHVCSMCIETN
jgi:hypothetical protein